MLSFSKYTIPYEAFVPSVINNLSHKYIFQLFLIVSRFTFLIMYSVNMKIS